MLYSVLKKVNIKGKILIVDSSNKIHEFGSGPNNLKIKLTTKSIEKKLFRDNRCSRPNKFASNDYPSVDYFLRHLLGKINFYGSVVLSNGQDDRNSTNRNLYKRIQTYENFLYKLSH